MSGAVYVLRAQGREILRDADRTVVEFYAIHAGFSYQNWPFSPVLKPGVSIITERANTQKEPRP